MARIRDGWIKNRATQKKKSPQSNQWLLDRTEFFNIKRNKIKLPKPTDIVYTDEDGNAIRQ